MKQALPAVLEGLTRPFQGRGRGLGYPTANIAAQTDLADGVYFGHADLGDYQHQPALIFIGVPTTVGDPGRRVEAHLLDVPDKDYYGLNIRLELAKFHRPNEKFSSVEDLLVVMKEDEAAARTWFKTA